MFPRLGVCRFPPETKLNLNKGDRLDFIVHANRSANSDSFSWKIQLRQAPADSAATKPKFAARASADFNYQRDIMAGTNGPGSWTYWMADLVTAEDGSLNLENRQPIRQLDENSLKLTPKSQFPVPDSDLGYLSLYPTGGHPGNDTKAVIRRWRANVTGKYRVTGEAHRPSDKGDGIRAIIRTKDGKVLKDLVIQDTNKHPANLAEMGPVRRDVARFHRG